MKKTALRIICFILMLGTVLGYVNKVFQLKDKAGAYIVTTFYKLKNNTVDVLFLGSSHAYTAFNTGILWDEYGIASYVLGGSDQPMWNTYYYLKEALKTQTPELIVLEPFTLVHGFYVPKDGRIMMNTYGLRWSADKVNSIKAAVPEERWGEFLLDYAQYHTRYTALSAADFLKNQNDRFYDDWKGFYPLTDISPQESSDVSGVTERKDLDEKAEQYYRATIELALMNHIPIVVVTSPYPDVDEHAQRIYNTAGDIAAEYGIPFLNCNLFHDKIGLDYSTDAADSGHLNYRGSPKCTKFIGAYLKENFTISDRRGDAAYESWQRNAAYLDQMVEDQILTETNNIGQIAKRLKDPNYWVFITVDGSCTTSDENLQSFFYTLRLPADGSCGIWYRSADHLSWYSQMEEAEQYIRTAHDFCMRRTVNDDGTYSNAIIIDNTRYQKVSNGVNIVVYDTVTEKVADTIGINLDDGYKVVR